MSAPAADSPKGSAAKPKDPYVEFAEKIFIQLASNVYSNLAAPNKPDPKALAAYCFKLVDAFEQASNETPRRLAAIEAANKAAVKLDQVDISSMFAANPGAGPAPAAAPAPAKK
jgi:hypothetical protein